MPCEMLFAAFKASKGLTNLRIQLYLQISLNNPHPWGFPVNAQVQVTRSSLSLHQVKLILASSTRDAEGHPNAHAVPAVVWPKSVHVFNVPHWFAIVQDLHMPLHVQGQVVWARKGTVTQVTLEGPMTSVFAEVACKLIGSGKLPSTSFPVAVIRFFTSMGS